MGRRLDLFPAGSDFPAGPTLSPLNIMESVGSTGPTKRFHGPGIGSVQRLERRPGKSDILVRRASYLYVDIYINEPPTI